MHIWASNCYIWHALWICTDQCLYVNKSINKIYSYKAIISLKNTYCRLNHLLHVLIFLWKDRNLFKDEEEQKSYGFETTWGWVNDHNFFFFWWNNPLKYCVNCKRERVCVCVCVCVRLTSCKPRVCLSSSETLSSDSSWLLCRICSLSLKPWFCFLLFVRASRVLSNLSCAHITHTDKYEQASIHTCIITHPHPVLMRRLFFSSLLPVSCLFPLSPHSFPSLGSLFIGMSWQVSNRLKKVYTEATVFLFVQHL